MPSRTPSASARLRLMERPDRGQIAAILVRVGIADHHLLMAARGDGRGRLRAGRGSRAMIAGAFWRSPIVSNRGTAMIGVSAGVAGTVEAGLLQEDVDLEQVGQAVRLRDDVGGDRRRPVARMRLGRRARDRELRPGLVRIDGEGTGRAVAGWPARGAAARSGPHPRALIIALDAGDGEQFGHDALVHVGILAQVQRGEVEAERLDRADQPFELPVRLRGASASTRMLRSASRSSGCA